MTGQDVRNQQDATHPTALTEAEPLTPREVALEIASRARYVGAAIRQNHVMIATVQGGAAAGFQLISERSAQIELEGADQEALRAFVATVSAFVRDACIDRLLLRSLPTRGRFNIALAQKVEAGLQLVPGLTVDIVHFNTIEKWKRHSLSICPPVPRGLRRWEEEGLSNAMATACYGEMERRPPSPSDLGPEDPSS